MKCIRCGKEMTPTTDGNYDCLKCDIHLNDLVYRTSNVNVLNEFNEPNVDNDAEELNATTIYKYEKEIAMLCKWLEEKEQYIKELESQLNTSKKAIEEMQKDIKSQKAVADLYLTIASTSATKMSIADAVRKYICEEIRKQCVYTTGTTQVCPDTSISTYNLNEILNKIEKDIEDGNKNKI